MFATTTTVEPELKTCMHYRIEEWTEVHKLSKHVDSVHLKRDNDASIVIIRNKITLRETNCISFRLYCWIEAGLIIITEELKRDPNGVLRGTHVPSCLCLNPLMEFCTSSHFSSIMQSR